MYTRPIIITEHEARRFWSQVGLEDEHGCRLWEGPTKADRGMYGVFYLEDGSSLLAHRVAFVLEVGPIEEGETLAHTTEWCKDWCVASDHLEKREVIRRWRTVGTGREDQSVAPSKSGQTKTGLSEEQVRRVRLLLGSPVERPSVIKQEVMRRMAVRLGVSYDQLRRAWLTSG